jgi:hypothetical protein
LRRKRHVVAIELDARGFKRLAQVGFVTCHQGRRIPILECNDITTAAAAARSRLSI